MEGETLGLKCGGYIKLVKPKTDHYRLLRTELFVLPVYHLNTRGWEALGSWIWLGLGVNLLNFLANVRISISSLKNELCYGLYFMLM